MAAPFEEPRKARLEPQPWAWGDRPRVLVEHADAAEGLRIATALRQAGCAVAICPGPAAGARCPLVAGEGCAAAHGADVIVSSLPDDRPETAEVRPMLRVRCADVPLIEGSALAPEQVAAAVREAIAVRADAPRTRRGTTGPRWNPFRSEQQAFRFVLVTLAVFAAVALAGVLGGPWPAVGVWLFLTVAVGLLYLLRGRRGRGLASAPDRDGTGREHRIVVAVEAEPNVVALAERIRQHAAGRRAAIQVVGLPRVSSLRRWTSDVDAPSGRAAALVERTLAGLRERGLEASGVVGDEDPLQAIEDVLRSFSADQLVVASAREEDAGALEAIAARARDRFALPAEVVAAHR
jgi:hypothetical protein